LNWDAIGAIGEIIGAFAVVVTLLYLARDIRQNSRSLAITALRDTTAQWNHWSEMLASSVDLADVVARGNRDYAGLSESETLRYGAFVQSFFDNVESYRTLVVEHRVDRDLSVLTSIVARRIRIAGFAACWDAFRADYADEFASWIDGIRREAGEGGAADGRC